MSIHGDWTVGKSWRRRCTVQNLNVEVTNGVSDLGLLNSQLTHSRRILLFPFGNSNAPPNDTVSVYLDYAEPKKAPEGWHACAQFALVISNIHDPTIYTVSRACHIYCCARTFLIFHPFPKMLIIDLSLRSVTGVLRVSASCASYSVCKKDTVDRQLKEKQPIYQFSYAC